MSYLKRVPDFNAENWKEMIVTILAHEFYHLKLFQKKKKQSEVKCDKYALKRLNKYRGEQSPL